MRKVLLFAAVTAIAFLYSCKTKVSDEIVPQITEDDLIELDGDLDDNFLSSWEYIVLDDKEIDAIVPGMYTNVMYDEGLYFVRRSYQPRGRRSAPVQPRRGSGSYRFYRSAADGQV